MKVRDLLAEIEECKKEYGDSFLDWDIYTEQICQPDREFKKGEQKWDWIQGGEGWEYFKCVGFWTIFVDKKIFTVNVNY